MELKLTELSNGGGCGCKIEPRILNRILKNTTNTWMTTLKFILILNS